ncbi:MAG: 2'-5' RNA ligase family protein [Polaromonas sp.]|uniref:2'-5' RNA ligase family protein n=1 Tax=Polaromonas sp. TaxID=1869339 RepID=UPI00271D8762|nr:2'-5' RNA ligase family protein [Polaromonas sp.]MDO9114136.1 2'-5' RNA ligase family protein [Polaromonas sp.]MDP1885618.1 2'-5' RNA ligase family protein [Polaromonas sp.]
MIFTVAMPKWSADAQASVQRFRRAHDPQFGLIAPHFTLVFGATLEEEAYVAHVRAVARAAKPLAFSLSHAMLYYTGDGPAHVYLVASEGAAALTRLYRQLHGGPMAPWLRLDKPFVPHITIAALGDPAAALQIADEWNAQNLCLSGEIDALTAGRISDGGFRVLAETSLEATQ